MQAVPCYHISSGYRSLTIYCFDKITRKVETENRFFPYKKLPRFEKYLAICKTLKKMKVMNPSYRMTEAEKKIASRKPRKMKCAVYWKRDCSLYHPTSTAQFVECSHESCKVYQSWLKEKQMEKNR